MIRLIYRYALITPPPQITSFLVFVGEGVGQPSDEQYATITSHVDFTKRFSPLPPRYGLALKAHATNRWSSSSSTFSFRAILLRDYPLSSAAYLEE